MYAITKRDYLFEGIVRVQDGTERRLFPSIEEAEMWVIDGAKMLNGTTITVDDIAYFETVPKVIKVDEPVERDEFTGNYVVCIFSANSGWEWASHVRPYAEAVAILSALTQNFKHNVRDNPNWRGDFYALQRERDAIILPRGDF